MSDCEKNLLKNKEDPFLEIFVKGSQCDYCGSKGVIALINLFPQENFDDVPMKVKAYVVAKKCMKCFKGHK